MIKNLIFISVSHVNYDLIDLNFKNFIKNPLTVQVYGMVS